MIRKSKQFLDYLNSGWGMVQRIAVVLLAASNAVFLLALGACGHSLIGMASAPFAAIAVMGIQGLVCDLRSARRGRSDPAEVNS